MRRAMLPAALALLAAPAFAQEGPEDPPWNQADDTYGADAMAAARAHVQSHHGGQRWMQVMADRLEWQSGDEETALWDLQGYYGGDLSRVWLKSEGEYGFGEDAVEDAEVQLLYGRAISSYFDLQAGVRQDFEPDGRTYAVLGVQGLVPYFFELDAAAFLSDEGDLSARIEAEYDILLTQRLILQPRAEIDLSASEVPERQVGEGVASVSLGARLRYEVKRSFAPYVGVEWSVAPGESGARTEAAGGESEDTKLVAGVRAWF
ncbi:copper resistance protein B [Parvularcula dongshanensis]|uniref:Copper resistance protein B n=1 Tax=Parvularcula dongshanensis TaxID=1173995 RepID=A0A840I571_9PROT|nr:copper resistance protein B [Parvularcula dongshanensis]MBB4659927.1 copper resistance protein B [Parvularcula dongshanensis]